MKKIDEDKLRKFFDQAKAIGAPTGFADPKLAEVVLDQEHLGVGLVEFFMCHAGEKGLHAAVLSVWTSGFQFARAYEQAQVEMAELDKIAGIEKLKRKRKPAGLSDQNRAKGGV